MKNCLFCDFVTGDQESHIVWQDKKHLAVLDINPVKTGHVLLLPRQHFEYIFDMPDNEYQAIWIAARRLALPLSSALNSKRTGIVVEGFGVSHLHIHLVPVDKGGELDPNKATRAAPEELRSLQTRLSTVFRSIA